MNRPLAARVEKADSPALGLLAPGGLHVNAPGAELLERPAPQRVVAERGVERRAPRELAQLYSRVRPTPGSGLPRLGCLDDLSGLRRALDMEELHPLDVTDDGNLHGPSLTPRQASALEHMMALVSIPPFEEFYGAHRDRVYRLLVRRVGRQQAEDAFQETFLRALRAYDGAATRGPAPRLGDYVAERVVIDAHRRSRSTDELRETETWDGRPPHAELEHLAASCRRPNGPPSSSATATTSTTSRSARCWARMRPPRGRPPRPAFAVCEKELT